MSVDLKLGIDASGAKKGAADVRNAIASIRNALTGLEKDSAGAFASLRKGMQVSPGKGVDAPIRATEAAMQRLQAAAINATTTAGTQAAKLRAQFEALGDTAGLQRVEQAFTRLQSAAAKAVNTGALGVAKAEYKAAVTGLTAEAKAQEMAASAAAKHAAEVESLRKRHDSIFAVSKRYEASLAEIAELEQRGALTAEKAAQARARAAQQLEDGAVATGRYGQALRVNQFNVTNFSNEIYDLQGKANRFDMRQVAMQLSQVGSQGAVTGNYLQALAIQLPDLALAFGPVGIIAGTVAGVIGTTLFSSMKSASNATDELKTSTDALRQAAERSSGNWDDVRKDYGALTADIKELVHAQRILAAATASNDLQKARDAMYSDQGAVGWLDSLKGYSATAIGNIRRIRDEFSVTSEVAARMAKLFEQASTETNAGNLANLYAQLRRELEMSTDGFTNMTDEQRKLLADLVAGEDAARRLAAATGDIVPGLSASADEAQRLERALLRSLSLRNRSDATTYSGRGSGAEWNYQEPTPGTKWTMSDITERERAQERAARAAARSAKSAAARISSSERMTNRLQQENIALNALKDGLFETSTAADMYAEAFLKSGGAVDAATMSALKQADAVAHANEQLRKIVQTQKAGGSLQENVSQSMKSGLKSGLSSALQGDTQSFAKTLGDSVYRSLATAISDALVDNLFAKNAAGVASGGGGFFSGILGIFGAGSEGGYSDSLPGRQAMPFSAFKNAPHYAEGTANTSGGIPAVLHKNEAVVPLTRGRKIPVDISGAGGGGSVVVGDINIQVDGAEKSDAELATTIAKRIEETVINIADTRIANAARYGGPLNRRGG